MVTKKSTIAFILFATFTDSDFARIRLNQVEGKRKFETQVPIAAQNDAKDINKAVVEDRIDKAFVDEATLAADVAKIHSTGARLTALEFPAALVQEAAAQGGATHIPTPKGRTATQKIVEAGRELLGFLLDTVRKRMGVVPNDTPSSSSKTLDYVERTANSFTKTLDYVKRAPDYYSRLTILNVACDSSAFSCEEIVQLVDHCQRPLSLYCWKAGRMVFAKGRHGAGCISDPDNAMSIIDPDNAMSRVVSHDPGAQQAFRDLKQAFIDNDKLKPAKGVGPPPMQLQTGLRTDEDMETLLRNMTELQLIKAYGPGFIKAYGPGLYQPGSPRVDEFESWLKQIRAQGEQFSGSQLVTLVNAIPQNSGTLPPQVHAVHALLQYLEQYVTGVTCEEVKQILRQIGLSRSGRSWLEGLDALKSNIIDGENKVDLVAFTGEMFKVEPSVYWRDDAVILDQTAKVLKDVGVGLPLKNNPIFGVPKGNPVILVVDESSPMDMNFTLGGDTFTRRKFCHNQLEIVLEGLPDGTYFNVIQYSSSAVQIFQKPVIRSKTNIDATMEAMGSSWRGNFTPGQDPSEMLRNIKVFALNFKHIERSAKRNSMEALQMAYATADMPSQQTDTPAADMLLQIHPLYDDGAHVATKDLPQIYFLTSGQPDGGAEQILENIGEFDNDRNIPVNLIAFIMPADPVAKQFAKDLANKTGGFFRSIEQAS